MSISTLEKKPLNRSTMVKWIMTVMVPLLLALLPVSDFYTRQVKLFFVITVFSLCVIAFELLNVLIIAALMPALWGIFKVAPMNVIMAPWTTTTLFMVMGSFALAASLEECGALKRIAYGLMSRVGKNYMAMLFSIFGAGAIMTALTFGNAYILMAALCFGLCRSLNILGTRMSAAIAMVCMIGTCTAKTFNYCAMSYGIIIGMAQGLLEGFSVNFFQAVGHNIPMFFVCLLTVWVIGKWYKADAILNSKAYFQEELQKMGVMTKIEKINLLVLGCIIVFLLTNPLHHLDSAYAFMIFPWLLFLPIFRDNESAGGNALGKSINFEMLIFMASCMAIGTVATSLGLGDVLAQVFVPFFAGSDSYFGIFGLMFAVVFLLNFFMTPLAIWSTLTVPVMQLAIMSDLNPLPFVYALLHSAEAIILPYEYVCYLAIYAFGMMNMKDFIKLSLVRCTIFFAGFLFVLIPYWQFIGLLE